MAALFIISVYFVVITVLFLYIAVKPVDKQFKHLVGKRRARMPPGPSGAPIVGNLLQFFKARDSGSIVQYLCSLCQYGSMTTMHLGSQTWVVLNDDLVIQDIINKRGNITHDRPWMPIANGLVGNGKRILLRQSSSWADARRAMHHLLSGTSLKRFAYWQEAETAALMSSLLENPKEWYNHIARLSTAVSYRIVMGERLNKTIEEINEFQTVAKEFVGSLNGSMVDFFPILDSLPQNMQPWRSYWSIMGKRHKQISRKWWDPVSSAVKQGIAKPCFVRDALLRQDIPYKQGDEEEAMYLATSVILAGSDNSRKVFLVFFMAMISHPQVFAQARADLDKVYGQDTKPQLPQITDMKQFPYILAIIKELLRWRPTIPLTPHHQSTEDLEYGGYYFPRGTNFMINVVGASQTVKRPERFEPERWLDGNEDQITQGIWVFGGGRRICAGNRILQQMLFVAIARLILCFDIFPNGPFDTQNLNLNTEDEPFPVSVVVRGPQYRELLQEDLRNWNLSS